MSFFKSSSLVKAAAMTAGFAFSTGATVSAQAADWNTTSFLIMQGNSYKDVVTDKEYDASLITLEHVDGWKYGSNFFFIDVTEPNNANSEFYGEFSPGLSFSKMTGADLSFGILKDVSIETTWELGSVSNAKLFGLGFAFDIPHVPVFKMNVYQRFSESTFYPGETGSAPQVTFVWFAPFSLGPTNWVFEGFFDYAFEEEEVGKKENIITSPRLTMDVGEFMGMPKQFYAGVEYNYWMNKYGNDGIDESNPQIAFKWTF